MTDLSLTIAPKSDQLNSDDLIGGPKTIRITRVSGNEGSAEQPINIFFEGDNGKPYRPCKSMRRVLVHVWGKDGHAYVGRSMTLYRDPTVQFGGLAVGGTRISHMSHIDEPKTMALTATRANRKPFTVKPLKVEAPRADKVAEGVRALLQRIAGATDAACIAAEPDVVKQRAWLAKNRPELAAEVDTAFAAVDDPFATRADTITPDSPNAEEGRADTDRGEGFTETDLRRTNAEAFIATYTADLAKAGTLEEVEAVHARANDGAARIRREVPDLYAEKLSALRPTDAPERAVDPLFEGQG